ncbi:MAG TPA: hypothetical protein VHM19_20475, partial [Polyangiales bacterium]|nr:hypothetical protein [Polyangiales bacterium]
MEAVRQRAQLGARIGAASGLVYGALELLLLGPVRRLSLDATVNLSLRGNLLVLVLYGVLGAAAGALLAAAVAPRREAPAFSLHQRAASAVTLLISALTALQVIAHRADLRAPRMLLAACAVCA